LDSDSIGVNPSVDGDSCPHWLTLVEQEFKICKQRLIKYSWFFCCHLFVPHPLQIQKKQTCLEHKQQHKPVISVPDCCTHRLFRT
jgi:hypothetical protein